MFFFSILAKTAFGGRAKKIISCKRIRGKILLTLTLHVWIEFVIAVLPTFFLTHTRTGNAISSSARRKKEQNSLLPSLKSDFHEKRWSQIKVSSEGAPCYEPSSITILKNFYYSLFFNFWLQMTWQKFKMEYSSNRLYNQIPYFSNVVDFVQDCLYAQYVFCSLMISDTYFNLKSQETFRVCPIFLMVDIIVTAL